MSCTWRAEFESAACRRLPSDFFISFASAHSTPDRPKTFHHFFDFKHHHSTHTDGPAFCGCSRASKNIWKCQKPLSKPTFAWTQGSSWGSLPPQGSVPVDSALGGRSWELVKCGLAKMCRYQAPVGGPWRFDWPRSPLRCGPTLPTLDTSVLP